MKNKVKNIHCILFSTLLSGFSCLSPSYAESNNGIIQYNKTEGAHIDLFPINKDFPRSDIKFGNWVIGQFSGIKATDFFLYNSISHSHPIIVTPKDEVIINHLYDNVQLWDAYDKLPSPLNVQISYGKNKASSGTAIGVQSTLDIYNESVPTHGHNEFSSYYAYVRANNHGYHPPGQHYWVTDFHLATPYAPEAAHSPELEIVYSGRIMNMSNGVQVLSANHMGAYGQSLVATPMLKSELEESGIPVEARSYPITALMSLAGFSGNEHTYTGVSPSATPAAAYALRIGGGGGSPYIPFDARSNFSTGIGLYDWSSSGLDIDHRLPGAKGPGIRNSYATELGGSLPSEAWPYSLILHDEHPSSLDRTTAGLQIGDTPHAWLVSNSQSNLTIAYKSPEHSSVILSANGIGFMGKPPITPPTLHPKFDLSKKVDPQELAKAYNTLHDALTSLGLAQ